MTDDTTRREQAGDIGQQMMFPTIPAETAIDQPKPRKKDMGYDYSKPSIEPSGKKNILVLSLLRKHPNGLTTVELVEHGVPDPRPRIRDLRELHHRIETIQVNPHDVGRYVLFSSKGVEQ